MADDAGTTGADLAAYYDSMTGPSAYFFGYIGAASAVIFANMGSAYGTSKAGVGVLSSGVIDPSNVMKNIVPVVMAGVLGIYGLVVTVLLSTIAAPAVGFIDEAKYPGVMSICPGGSCFTYADGFKALAGGLSCGTAGLGAGMAIGIAGDAGVRAVSQQPKLYTGMILILIFGEAIALYGLIVSLVLSTL